MIANLLINIVFYLLGFIASFLPQVSDISENFSQGVASFLSYISSFSLIFPFSDFFSAILIVLGFEVAFLMFKLVVFIFDRLPILGKK